MVKEAVHIATGKYYACKVINKRLMEGREHMVRSIIQSVGEDAVVSCEAARAQVRNEINVLKKISQGHRNIVTLHDVRAALMKTQRSHVR